MVVFTPIHQTPNFNQLMKIIIAEFIIKADQHQQIIHKIQQNQLLPNTPTMPQCLQCCLLYNSMYKSKLAKLIFCLSLCALINSLHFPLSLWKNYHLDSPHLIFSHSEYPFTIEFPDLLASQFQVKYIFSQHELVAEYTNSRKNLTMLSRDQSFGIYGLSAEDKVIISKNVQLSPQFELKLAKNFQEVAFQYEQLPNEKILIIGNCDLLILQRKEGNSIEQWNATLQKTSQNSQQRLLSWLKKSNINATYAAFAQEMLSHTISMICKQGPQKHVGLCDLAHYGTRHAKHQIDLRHSFLVIDLLRIEFTQTALFLFEHMINLLQDRLFYEQGQFKFLPIPEHIELFDFYSAIAKKDEKRLKLFSIKVKAVLNGLINQMLLSEVNHIEQEMNYRQNKKLHPTLYKMINMKWKATSPKHQISSVYQQSFTPDYFYNYPNQTVDTCVSKLAWLFKATLQYHDLVKVIGDADDLSSLQQPISLLKVLGYFTKGDSESQQGRFYSVNDIGGGVRIYAKHTGYQSLLPFIYQLSDRFPQNLFSNLTTKFGLASLNTDHPKVNTHYEYRGNIHSYFNYKILYWSKKVAKAQSKQEFAKVSTLVNPVVAKIRQLILKEWNQGRTFTMWTPEAIGLRHRKQLSLINVAFMQEQ